MACIAGSSPRAPASTKRPSGSGDSRAHLDRPLRPRGRRRAPHATLPGYGRDARLTGGAAHTTLSARIAAPGRSATVRHVACRACGRWWTQTSGLTRAHADRPRRPFPHFRIVRAGGRRSRHLRPMRPGRRPRACGEAPSRRAGRRTPAASPERRRARAASCRTRCRARCCRRRSWRACPGQWRSWSIMVRSPARGARRCRLGTWFEDGARALAPAVRLPDAGCLAACSGRWRARGSRADTPFERPDWRRGAAPVAERTSKLMPSVGMLRPHVPPIWVVFAAGWQA
jgi:hypothetical protein